MKHLGSKNSFILYSSLFFLLVLVGFPRLIGGDRLQHNKTPDAVPACSSKVDVLLFSDSRTNPETIAERYKDKPQFLLHFRKSKDEIKTDHVKRVCDANGNILNPYHGRYQAMVYQIFAPEKGFV